MHLRLIFLVSYNALAIANFCRNPVEIFDAFSREVSYASGNASISS